MVHTVGMSTASVRLMFIAQAVLFAAGQIILLFGILTYPGHSLQQPLGNLAAAIGFALVAAGYWALVTRLPAELIEKLRPAFMLFGIGDVASSIGLLAFLDFDASRGYPGYTIASEVVSVIGGLLLAAAWFCWLATGRAAAPQRVTLPPTQQPEDPIPS
jgi:hypothetical protein